MNLSMRLYGAYIASLALVNIAYADSKVETKVESAQKTTDSTISVQKDTNPTSINPKEAEKKTLNQAAGDTKKEDKKEKKKEEIKKGPLNFVSGDSILKTWAKLRLPEFFYGKNIRFLNNNNPTDRVLFFRHTLDISSEYSYGRESRGYDVLLAKMTIRNKGVWGDPESIGTTTESEIRELDVVFGAHRHAIPRHFLWIRELWLQMSLSDLFCLPFCNSHTITFGAFPFELGRGISLGSAYATDPSDIGYFFENAIDQYAFGGKLSGDIFKDRLLYDVYGAILNNKASTFDYTNARIRGQQFGHRNNQARGFGIINYILAARLRWNFLDREKTKVRFEPYGLYNHNPEHRIEFIGDGTSDLITLGVAGEAEIGNFEFGWDTAFNLGHQFVYGWDRNTITKENRAGTVVIVNSRVRQAPPGTVPSASRSPLALRVAANQEIVANSAVVAESSLQNGQIIGENSLGTLINDLHRFTNPYVNQFRGRMFVWDMSYYCLRPDLKVSAALGYASGDENPNKDLRRPNDAESPERTLYEGFIGLQETYSGTRVKSAFLLSGSGKIPRLLSFPVEESFDPYAHQAPRFTNLLFVGTGVTWKPSKSCRKWNVNPNLLAFWQDTPTRFFNRAIAKFVHHKEQADKFLGVELNLFIEAEVVQDLRFFGVAAVFFPGKHFRDLTGVPLNRAQQVFLENLDKIGPLGTAAINDHQPTLGSDTAFFTNIGLEFKF